MKYSKIYEPFFYSNFLQHFEQYQARGCRQAHNDRLHQIGRNGDRRRQGLRQKLLHQLLLEPVVVLQGKLFPSFKY